MFLGPGSSPNLGGGGGVESMYDENSSRASKLRYRTFTFLNANSVPIPAASEVRPDPIGPPITTCRAVTVWWGFISYEFLQFLRVHLTDSRFSIGEPDQVRQ